MQFFADLHFCFKTLLHCNMLYKIVLASALASANALSLSQEEIEQKFAAFKELHNKKYETDEEHDKRFSIFVDTLSLIEERNAAQLRLGGSPVHGVTRFADMTQEEFQTQFLDMNMPKKFRAHRGNATSIVTPPATSGVTAKDWTSTQTTAIKDQGHCGSCWAHAAAEQIESDGMRLLGNPSSLTLSVQQMVSCDHGNGQHGCNGGLQETAFDYVRDNGGIVTEQDYPYTSYEGRTGFCDKSKTNYVMGVKGYDFMFDSTVEETEKSFTNYMLSDTGGTISIGVDATTWSTYTGGVMIDCGKGTDINHSVQAVGVDTGSGGYWKIRNSWSPSWGEEGFIRVQYGTNTCGLVTEGGSYTTVYNI